jgi:formylglycine-generating enzyme required for sulfatase activity
MFLFCLLHVFAVWIALRHTVVRQIIAEGKWVMHLFISYAKKDTLEVARQLRDALQVIPGVTVWMDDSLQIAAQWAAQIQYEIDRCDYMIVLLSPDVNREPTKDQPHSFVLNEIAYAQAHNKTIIPVMVQPTVVPVMLAGRQYIDFTKNETIAMQRLIFYIAERAGIVIYVPPQDGEKTRPGRLQLPVWAVVFGLMVIIVQAAALVILLVNRPPAVRSEPTSVAQNNTPATLSLTNVMATVAPALTATAQAQLSQTPPAAPTTTATPTLSPTDTLIPVITRNTDWKPVSRNIDGVEMVLVPPGCFWMGSQDGSIDEKPTNRQCVYQPFWLDKMEVTNAQFQKFSGLAASLSTWTDANRPRERITWNEARDFCLKRSTRLPTEREWEYAARGPDNLNYPWGNDFVPTNVVYNGNSRGQTAIVGSQLGGASWVGALDMSGNVWEWVNSIYKPYAYDATDGRESESNNIRVLRGGSWNFNDYGTRATNRDPGQPTIKNSTIGFRCARDWDG